MGIPKLAAVLGVAALGVTALAVAPIAPTPANAAPLPAATSPYVPAATAPGVDELTDAQRSTLTQYLTDTYASLVAMTDPDTGLPSDNIGGDLAADTIGTYTSPTNIGGYLWSTVVARDAGLITADEAYDKMATTLDTLSGMQRHDPSGMFYNWYDPATGDRVTIWPDNGNVVNQFLSSVDNGWLAAGLRIVASAEPRLDAEASALYDSMNFGVYYNPNARADLGVGLLRGGFWDEEPINQGGWVLGDYLNTGTPVYYTGHHYDTTVSETRIATYIGIANGQVPPEAYYASWRTFPSTCDWSWQDQRPTGATRTYLGIDVYEGAYNYRGMSIVPGWGGSMFEALMPDMLVPESEWGPTSWGVNHPLVVKAHKEHGLDEAGYGYWGFSPASNPHGGYAEYGVDVLGLRSDGYLSDGVTDVDLGFPGCREATNATPEFQDGVVTPHASFLGLAYDPEGVLDNLANLKADFDAYGDGGFFDAIAVRTGTVAHRYLSLDQSMIVAAIGNYMYDGTLRDHFVDASLEQALRPLMAAEVFSASASAVVPTLTSHVDGESVASSPAAFAGTGEPGARLTLTATPEAARAITEVCSADVDADGRWSCDSPVALAAGVHSLSLATLNLADISVAGATTTRLEVLAAPATTPPTTPDPVDPTDPATPAGPANPVAPGFVPPSADLADTGAHGIGTLLGLSAITLALGGTAWVALARRRAKV